MPVTPDKIKAKYQGKNEEFDLINGKNISRINAFKLPVWEMSLLIPAFEYPFRNKVGVVRNRDYYLNHFNNLAAKKMPFNMLIIRTLPNGDFDFGNNTGAFISNNNGIIINTAVSLEEYMVTDSSGNGFDIIIDVKIKKYIGYGTQKIEIGKDNKANSIVSQTRPDTKAAPKSYTVKKGDTLYNICRAQLGDGNRYKDIAKLNNIANANLIYPGQIIRFE